MTTFSTLTLHFGADGLPGEPPLSFEAAPVNLIVGPNNAGKSLFLRELYGSDPRHEGWRSRDIKERSVVARASWDAAGLRHHQREVLLSCIEASDVTFGQCRHRDWDELLALLSESERRLSEATADLLSALKRIGAEILDEEAQRLLAIGELFAGDEVPRIVGGLALLWYALARHERAALESNSAHAVLAPAQQARLEKARRDVALLEPPLREALLGTLSVFKALGHDVAGLDLDSLMDLEGMLAYAIRWADEHPFLSKLIGLRSVPQDLPPPDPELERRLQRLWQFRDLAVYPAPLRRLRERLEEGLEERAWDSDDGREAMRENALFLDGLKRLTMVAAGQARGFGQHSPGEPPVLQLLDDPVRRTQLRSLVYDALGQHLVVDGVTQTPTVFFRLAKDAPGELEPQRTAEAVAYLDSAAPLAERSDGIHAYIGMLAAVVAGDKPLVFIDEPEAFLHPPLTRRLAAQLCQLAAREGRQLFIATHSSDFLAACATSGVPVNVLRLSYDGERATARLLEHEGLKRLALEPRLRSSHPLSALFCDGAVVCEADRDRALYEEINTRLWSAGANPRQGVESCAFLNGESWQSLRLFIGPLRQMGVAAAAVVDMDVLFGAELEQLMGAAQIPERQRIALRNMAKAVKRSVVEKHGHEVEGNKTPKLNGELLPQLLEEDRRDLEKVIQDLAVYGVFVVPVGEVEDWFADAGIPRSKSLWLDRAWQYLGWDPESSDYKHPQQGDIWDFVRQIAAWIRNPERRGTSPQAL